MSNQKPVDVQLEKVHKLVRDDILQEKDREQQDPKRILLTVTYNRFNRTLQQLFANIGTSFKLTKLNGNYSKNTQPQPLRETKI